MPDIVARAQRGDVDAFGMLYRQHESRVFAICLRLAGDRQRAREFMHDAFVRAWERLGTFRGESAFGTWLHRLAVNVVLEAARRDQRRTARVDQVDDDETMTQAPALAAGDPLTRLALEEAIASLPPNARLVFVLHDVEGYAHDEIAGQMGLAPGTVRAHLHRARQLLMKRLAP